MLLEQNPTTPAPPAFVNGMQEAEPSAMDEFKRQAAQIQELLDRAQKLTDPARALVMECIETMMAFQGRGLEQVLDVVFSTGAEGEKVLDRMLKNEAVRALLLIHGLHPVDLPGRLQQALDKVRPYMESHGGNVELLSLENDVARLRLQGTCKTCPSSAVTLELAVRQAIEEFCPDLAGFEVEETNSAAAGIGAGHIGKAEGGT